MLESVVPGSIPSGCASLGDGWPAQTGSVPWREGNKIPLCSQTQLSSVRWTTGLSLAGTPAQPVFLLLLRHPHPFLLERKSGHSPDLVAELSCSSLGSCLHLKVSPAEAEEPSKKCRGKGCCSVCRQAAAVTVSALLLPRPSWMVIRALIQEDSAPAVEEAGLVPRSRARPSESGERVNSVGL